MQASAQNKINLTEWHINIITFDSMENLLTTACHKASLLVSSLSITLKVNVIHLKDFFFWLIRHREKLNQKNFPRLLEYYCSYFTESPCPPVTGYRKPQYSKLT